MTLRAVGRVLLIGSAVAATAAMCLLALQPVPAPSWEPPQGVRLTSEVDTSGL